MHKPPMVGPPELRNEPASLLPGGITYTSDPTGKAFRSAIDVRIDISHLSADIRETQERVKDAFYANLFLMMAESDRREITAREVDERHEEKMLMLGPVLERLHDELLDPLVKRVFSIMARHNMIPPLPRGVRPQQLTIEFISMLAQAQKAVATGAIERFWQFGMQIAAARPEAMDRLDPDGTMDAYADMTGVPANITVGLDKARKVRAARARAQQQQAALASVQQLAATAKNASQIDVGGGANAVQLALGRG
jgi:hypothetical protein